MNPKYEIILYWSEDDQAFVAEVPELPGCMAHGDSQAPRLPASTRRSRFGLPRRKSLEERCRRRRAGAWLMHDTGENNLSAGYLILNWNFPPPPREPRGHTGTTGSGLASCLSRRTITGWGQLFHYHIPNGTPNKWGHPLAGRRQARSSGGAALAKKGRIEIGCPLPSFC